MSSPHQNQQSPGCSNSQGHAVEMKNGEVNTPFVPKPATRVKAANPYRGFSAAELTGTVFPEQRWAVPGLIPDGLTIFSGSPKMGKSWGALGVVLAIGSGGLAFGSIPVKAGDVLYLALEDTPRRLQQRLNILLAGLPDLPPGSLDRIHFVTEWPRMGMGGIEDLALYVSEHPGLRLIVIDTFAKFRPVSRPANSNAYELDYQHAGALKAFADKCRVAVLVIHHLRKATADDIHETLSGSQGLPAAADGSIVLKRTRGQAKAELHLTGRDIEEQVLSISWQADACRWTLNGPVEEGTASLERDEVLQVLKQAASPMSPQEVADALGKTRVTVSYLLGKLTTQGLAFKIGYGRYAAQATPQENTVGQSRKAFGQRGEASPPATVSPYTPTNTPHTTNSYHLKERENDVLKDGSVGSVGTVSGGLRRFSQRPETVSRAISLAARWTLENPDGFNRSALHRELAGQGVEVSSASNFSGWLNNRKELIAQEARRLADSQGVSHE